MLHRGSNCSLTRAIDGRIMRQGIISSCQSAATSERYSKYPTFTFAFYTATAAAATATTTTATTTTNEVVSVQMHR